MTCFDTELLTAAKADLGSNSDYGIPGTFCAIAVKGWIQKAADKLHIPMPIPGSPGALNTEQQLISRNMWLPVETARANPQIIQPGQLVVWHRGEPGACTGHIGVVVSPCDGSTFQTIEANAGPKVAVYTRRLDTPTLLGFGFFPCPTETSPTNLILAPATSFEDWILPVGVLAAAATTAFYLRRRKMRLSRRG